MTAWIGPVEVALEEPSLTVTSDSVALGIQTAQIGAMCDWTKAHQLRELVNNPARRVTIGGQSGILEPVYFTDDLLGPLTGWALLQPFGMSPQHEHSLSGTSGPVPYTLQAAFLGSTREVPLTRSARDKGNDYGLTAQSLIVNPFWDEDAAGSPFITDPGGTRFSRGYDANFPHETAGMPSARNVTIYHAPFVSGADPFGSIVLPPLAQSYTGPPGWVTDRGGDARAYDRRLALDIFGPVHNITQTTDLMLVNGLVRFWVGNKGLRPFLHCQAFDGAAWREPGTVQFGTDSDVLLHARIVRLTFEDVTVALTVAGKGDIFVSLYRGERMLRVTQPSGMALPTWSGIPPASRANSARITPAKFTNGLVAGFDVEDSSWAAPFSTWAGDDYHDWDGSPYEPDLRLRWPADVPASAWSCAWRYKPLFALSALGTVGLRTLYSEGGIAEVECYVDTDSKAKVRVADTIVIQSPVLSFEAGDDILIGLAYDGVTLTLSWKANNGTITRTSATVPITADVFYDDTYFVNFSRWGDGSWGDGEWGGVTHFPGGAIDNDMVFEDAITKAEFAALALATTALANLPVTEGRLRRYVPFDAQPLVSLGTLTSGRRVDPVTDDNGFTKLAAALTAELDECLVSLTTTTTGDTAADQHAQAVAQNNQRIRVR